MTTFRLRPGVFWPALLGLLLFEIVLVVVVLQGRVLLFDAAWWGGFVWQRQILSCVTTSSLTGLLIFWTAQIGQPRFGLWERLRRPHLAWPLLIVHLLGFLVFARITKTITFQGLQHGPEADALLVLWFGAGVFALLCWIAAVLPGTGSGIVLASVLAGLTAWLVGGGTLHIYDLWKRAAFDSVATLLRLIFPDVVSQPETGNLGTSRFQVNFGVGCSGCEGIGLIWVCLGLYLWCFRRDLRWPQALLLLPVGTVLVWLANILRIVVLVAIGVWISPKVALGGFHSEAGWLTFNGVALGLIAVSRRSRFFVGGEAAESQVEENPAAPYLGPLVVLVLFTMITSALSDGFDVLYPIRVVMVGLTLLAFWRTYAAWPWGWSWYAAGAGVAAFVLWMGLEFLRGAPDDIGLRAGLASLPAGWAVVWIGFRVLGSVVTVPLAEELGFRGYLLRRLVAADFRAVSPAQITWLAMIVSSVLFGLLHGRWVAGTLAGLLYALVLRRRGRVSDAVLAHAVTNGLIAAYVLVTGQWSLWS
jgi:exosortase E/protease (VPEID-CTERM system)